ncbi:3-phosphoshikimate 1-carboxyvinyltransferase [Phyllobacterium sp. YR620]|uniref:3-phosphoshikimate 1-carboxyvinyltransferase n=1 Tax=Phyllobacterium sp. YR620 TaxID=1881066 RepID=UPI0008823098|nr:3-phosphoshikimate 1-carboxyvinyltransferase [Phyllobacterium sp. YR620]SDO94734.1 3-phosphoshikimate 1-carboxyvinyltransferase [Phyllobacterium sp. YR620]
MSQRLVATITPPGRRLIGQITPPGSKSITNRALLLAAMAPGNSLIRGALKSDDTRYMSAAMRDMGVMVSEPDETSFALTSSGRLSSPAVPLFLGNAGTATRFITAAAAVVDGTVIVDGDDYMRLPPIEPLVVALRAAGIDIFSQAGYPPVTVRGTGRLKTSRIEIDGALSSQYVSAVLMIAPFGEGPIDIILSGPAIGARGYVDLTLAAMEKFGAMVEQTSDASWRVQPTGYIATDFIVEPDASAATYLWAAEAITNGSIDLGMPVEAFTQPDARAMATIRQFPRLPAVINGAQMQDAIPTIAVLAAFNETPVRFSGLSNLRVKECDRVSALAAGLNAIRPGLGIEEGDDLLVASDPGLQSSFSEVDIDTHSDHRIAMSFALAGLKLPGINILDSGCVAKTYPGYWNGLRSLGVAVKETSPS